MYVKRSRIAYTFGVGEYDYIIKAAPDSHVMFNNVAVKLTDEGVPLRLTDSSPLTGIGVARVSVLNIPPSSNVVQMGKIKPAAIMMAGERVSDVVRPSGDFIKLSKPNVTYALKYLSPVQI